MSQDDYFHGIGLPNELASDQDKHFGFVHKKHGPIVVGEVGRHIQRRH